MDTGVRRRLFTVDEYECMGRAGILHEDEHVELIDGEIIQMAAMSSRHFRCVMFLTRWLIPRLGDRALVSSQSLVRLPPGTEPEPDIAVLRYRADMYGSAIPSAEDVLLIIEVADTSLVYDRDTKLPLYAAAGIPGVWIVDLEGERVLMYRRPHAGAYKQTETVARGGMLVPEAFPDLALSVDELLG